MSKLAITAQDLIRLRHLANAVSLGGRRPVSSVIAGAHLSRFRGRGVDFLESRHYQMGDDIRDLDWKVTARTGEPHTKVFQEERERPVIVLLDLEPAMFFATRGRLKAVLGAELAALVGWAAVRRGDRIGALVFRGDDHHELRPRGGRRGVMRLVHAMEQAFGDWCTPSARLQHSGLAGALQRLRRVARPGSLVLLISDFRGLDESCERHLSRLRQHTDVAAFQLRDVIEREVPQPGLYPISDGRREGVLDLRTRAARDEYQRRVIDPGRLAQSRLARFAIPVIDADCQEEPIQLVEKMFGGRRRAA